MKQITLILALATAITIVLSGCSPAENTAISSNQNTVNSTMPATGANFDLKVSKWGPETTKVGEVPNKQPDGSMGIWIEVASTDGLGDAQVLFAGKPAKITSVLPKMITAGVNTEELAILGVKEVAVRQVSTGKVFPIGTFKVTLGAK